jgi:hypothetical protein
LIPELNVSHSRPRGAQLDYQNEPSLANHKTRLIFITPEERGPKIEFCSLGIWGSPKTATYLLSGPIVPGLGQVVNRGSNWGLKLA